jgi:hypothetical protein
MTSDERRTQALTSFSQATGLPAIGRIEQRGRDPQTALYTIQFADGRNVRVGTIKILWSQAELARVFAVAIGIVPPAVDPSAWRIAIGVLINCATDVIETNGESFETLVSEWVRAYTAKAAPSPHHAAPAGDPYTDNNELYVSANSLARYVRREYSEQVDSHALRVALVDIGFERETVYYTRNGKRSSTSYYHCPLDRLDDTE